MRAVTSRARTVFSAPADLTADAPPEARGIGRDGVRLLVAEEGGIRHTTFRSIGEHLRAGDLLVVNNSAMVGRELDGRLRGRRRVVVHVATELDDSTWVIELRTAPDAARPVLDAAAGDIVDVRGRRGHARDHGALGLERPYPAAQGSPTGVGNRLWSTRVVDGDDFARLLAERGRPIAYGYLRSRYPIAAYSTAFGLIPGSAEMASAGRPFTPELVTSLVAAGVVVVPVTLHTGLSSQEAGEVPQPERFAVSATSAAIVNAVRHHGGRIVAVGTTATRALESATSADGVVHAAAGWTDLVISPERPVRVVDGLITGWHDAEASHLLLVESVAGAELTQRAYDAAISERYAWHEFGDSALFLPGQRP